jgi:hypothetical protein
MAQTVEIAGPMGGDSQPKLRINRADRVFRKSSHG